MRLGSVKTEAGPRAALVRDGVVHEIEGYEGSVEELLHAGLPSSLPAAAPVRDPELLQPLSRPGKLVCIGLNYVSHCEEQGAEPPETPTFFAKFANALAPPGATVELPPWSEKVDYEAEVAFVIGERCKDVPEADALRYVAGYTLLNDLSARDYQFKTAQWMPGKVFDGTAPCGPALVTPDEAGPPDAIEIELRLNGEVRQSASTADLVHSVPALVAYLSKLMTLEPGDLVATGTPAGVGSLRKSRSWLEAGDEIVISSPQLGVLETRIA
jgi:acylpyruvate hydrolase